jgi:hypothetical protein
VDFRQFADFQPLTAGRLIPVFVPGIIAMKLSEVFAHLSVMNQEPLGGFTEIYRALREESGKLAATERKLAKAAAAAGYTPPDWGGRFTDLFVGRSGPGGGVDVTPAVLAFFLISVPT